MADDSKEALILTEEFLVKEYRKYSVILGLCLIILCVLLVYRSFIVAILPGLFILKNIFYWYTVGESLKRILNEIKE